MASASVSIRQALSFTALFLSASVHAGYNFTCVDKPNPDPKLPCNVLGELNCITERDYYAEPFPIGTFEECCAVGAGLSAVNSFAYNSVSTTCHLYSGSLYNYCLLANPHSNTTYSEYACVNCTPSNKDIPRASCQNKNLIYNPGFEWSHYPKDQGPWSLSPRMDFHVTSPGSKSSNAITTNQTDFTVVQNLQRVCLDGWHKVSFDYEVMSDHPKVPLWTVQIVSYGANRIQFKPVTGSWQTFSDYILDPAPTNAGYQFQVASSAASREGRTIRKVSLDNFFLAPISSTFAPVPGAPNILVNGDFETGVRAPFKNYRGTQIRDGFMITSPGLGGSKYAYSTRYGEGYTSQKVNSTIGTAYIFTFEYAAVMPVNATWYFQPTIYRPGLGQKVVNSGLSFPLYPGPGNTTTNGTGTFSFPFVAHSNNTIVQFTFHRDCPYKFCNTTRMNQISSMTIDNLKLQELQI